MGKLTEKDKQEIRDSYYIMTSTELAKKYDVSRGVITKIWYDAGLKGKAVKYSNPRSTDLTGQKINALTVLEASDLRSASGGIKWKCQCDCGNITYVEASRLRSKKAKSCGCLSKKALEIGRGLFFQDLSNQTFGKLTVIERAEDKIFENNRKAVQWKCSCDCGNEVTVLASNLKNGNTQSCGLCNKNSHGNLKIEKLLKENNISYIREYRFQDCKSILPLPFDFFVNNTYLIEYDGKQHFENSNSFFESYEEIHKRDLIKSQWCKENHIPLIRIPFTHYNNLTIQDLLLETTSFIEK